jgi:hypothetical protein
VKPIIAGGHALADGRQAELELGHATATPLKAEARHPSGESRI